MGDDWQKIREQRLFPFVFTSEDSGEIIYYVCQTLFFSDPPQVLEGMPEPLLEIVQPDAADSREARTVSGLPAVLYLRESRAYLCWTVSEEYSLCLSYDPSLVLENEILQMAESVPANLPGT